MSNGENKAGFRWRAGAIVRSHRRLTYAAATLAVAAVSASVSFASGAVEDHAAEKHLEAALAKSLPNTKVSAIDCSISTPKGFCEVVAGQNVFYATPDGRYVVVGQVLDLEKKADLTERRRRELTSIANLEETIGRGGAAAQAARAQQPPEPTPPSKLAVDLPASNAIVHNKGGRLKMTVFTDFNCHYCQQLFHDLKGNKDIEVTEYPIAFLGPDSATKAKLVLCAPDKEAAASALYYGGELKSHGECEAGEKALQQNIQFAQAHGIAGTPMIVRADGVTNPGWMPADRLAAWLAEAAKS